MKLHRKGAVGFIVWLGLFNAKTKCLEWLTIEPQVECILSFWIARCNLKVLNIHRVNLGRRRFPAA